MRHNCKCRVCGKEFVSTGRRRNSCYSSVCQKAYGSATRRETKCIWCGVSFMGSYASKFCTSICSKAHNSRDQGRRTELSFFVAGEEEKLRRRCRQRAIEGVSRPDMMEMFPESMVKETIFSLNEEEKKMRSDSSIGVSEWLESHREASRGDLHRVANERHWKHLRGNIAARANAKRNGSSFIPKTNGVDGW